eukprot:1265529-Rhodomonas_salina.1
MRGNFLGIRYAMPGTEIGYNAIRTTQPFSSELPPSMYKPHYRAAPARGVRRAFARYATLSAYARAMPCALLTYRMMLPAVSITPPAGSGGAGADSSVYAGTEGDILLPGAWGGVSESVLAHPRTMAALLQVSTSLRVWYATSGTDIQHPPPKIRLRKWGAVRYSVGSSENDSPWVVPRYPTPCLVLMSGGSMPLSSHAMSGTDSGLLPGCAAMSVSSLAGGAYSPTTTVYAQPGTDHGVCFRAKLQKSRAGSRSSTACTPRTPAARSVNSATLLQSTPLPSYALSTKSPALTSAYALVPGGSQPHGGGRAAGITLRTRYSMSGTDWQRCYAVLRPEIEAQMGGREKSAVKVSQLCQLRVPGTGMSYAYLDTWVVLSCAYGCTEA